MNACRDIGLTIPGDIALVGFDDLPASKELSPSLSTVRISRKSIAERAFHHLIDYQRGLVPPPPEKILIAGRLMIRESS
jgi:LacI family transcriptional regulator